MFNFLKRFRGKIKAEKKEEPQVIIPIREGSFVETALEFGGYLTSYEAFDLFRKNSTVSTAVEMIASKIEQITPIVKDENNKITNKHPILEMLKRPEPFTDWGAFIGDLGRNFLITNNGYLSLLGNKDRPPLEIYSINPQNISVTQAADDYPAMYFNMAGPARGNYQRVQENRNVRFINDAFKELVHLRGYTSHTAKLRGDSPLEAALLEIQQQILGRNHNVSILKNGGRLSLIVNFKEEEMPSQDEHQERAKRINEDLSGSANAGKIAIISGPDVSIQEAGIHNKDMDFAKLDELARQILYLKYKIPLPLVSTDASTYNNYENALFDLYENTITPLLNTVLGILTYSFSLRDAIEEDSKLSFDPASIGILARQNLNQLEKRKNIGIETPNELRSLIGRERLSKGGDAVYQGANLVPLGDDLYTDDNIGTPEPPDLSNT